MSDLFRSSVVSIILSRARKPIKGEMIRMNSLFDLMPVRFRSSLDDSFFDLQRSHQNYAFESDNESLTLTVDLPGVAPADLNVQSIGNLIKISALRKGVEVKHQYKLSKLFDTTPSTAVLENGALTLKFPKLASEAPKTISVQAR